MGSEMCIRDSFIYNALMKSLECGLILLYSGRNVIRFLPPLVIEMDHLERAAEILEGIFAEEDKSLAERQKPPSS